MQQFDPDTASVGRLVTITAPVQERQGAQRALKIQAAPLPNLSRVKPNGAKGIEQVIAVVMNPVVYADDDTPINDFKPPLEVSVQFTKADVKKTALDAKGVPQLSLAVVYSSDDGWKWERLKTRVTLDASGGGTLSAKLRTLRPQDPIVMCRP